MTDASLDTSAPRHLDRWIGMHASARRRLAASVACGVVAAGIAFAFVPWAIAPIAGWDVTCLVWLAMIWITFLRADGALTEAVARKEDETRAGAALLLVLASVASIAAIGVPLSIAGRESGGLLVALIAVATVTVVLSWLVVNTVFTIRYADLYFRLGEPVIDFGDEEVPSYREFAYIAFTIGMTYQVSDTTLRHPALRRTVLRHALVSYLFGVVIVAAAINLIAGLVR